MKQTLAATLNRFQVITVINEAEQTRLVYNVQTEVDTTTVKILINNLRIGVPEVSR